MRALHSVHSKIVSWRAVMTQWITKQESAALSKQRDNSPYQYKVFTFNLLLSFGTITGHGSMFLYRFLH